MITTALNATGMALTCDSGLDLTPLSLELLLLPRVLPALPLPELSGFVSTGAIEKENEKVY